MRDTPATISKLSDHAAVLMRQRGAKAAYVILLESDDSVSIGFSVGDAPIGADEIQEMLCAAIAYNREQSTGG